MREVKQQVIQGMSRSRNKIFYKSGYKYQLVKQYEGVVAYKPDKHISTEFLELSQTGDITIRVGYAWDGATNAIDTDTFLRGSLVHDALYQLIRMGLLPREAREAADQELKTICLEDGMTRLRAWWVYKAVRSFGGLANRKRREIKIAP